MKIPLPNWFRVATEPHKYKVTLRLYTEDDQQAEGVYEGEFTPPPRPGLFARIWAALAAQPLIALAIVVVMSAVATAIILTNKGPQTQCATASAPPRRQYPGEPRGVRGAAALMFGLCNRRTPVGAPRESITRFPCTVGRDENCDICIRDPRLTRKHIEIDFKDGHFFVTDRESKNGTFINDVRLRTGAAIRVSGVVSVHLGDQTLLELDTGD